VEVRKQKLAGESEESDGFRKAPTPVLDDNDWCSARERTRITMIVTRYGVCRTLQLCSCSVQASRDRHPAPSSPPQCRKSASLALDFSFPVPPLPDS